MPDVKTNTEPVDTSNSIFQKAVAFVNDTVENLFLTGKAGTGKTTFLKYIKTHTTKQCAIVAPTGVAAINAGGETIHSFLQLPFGPFVPGNAGGFGRQGEGTQDKHSLLANLRLRETKIKLLRKLELLIIDEVSMVRCDLLDSMDLVLRHVRKNWAQPFGGVQVIFIGDLFQLPPVAREEDWEILKHSYASPYFFSAKVLEQYPPLYIELKKIYRQKEQGFIDILNRIRNGQVIPQDIEILNRQYDPASQKEPGYIILCTHNHIADSINQQELEKLGTDMHKFEGTVTSDFNTKNLPAEQTLQLKKGAQVMFLKNDVQTPRRYYNGRIGTVAEINSAGIWVSFPGEETERMLVEKETWKNMRYSLNQQTGQIEEEESGSFTQFPLRLAWAITVHKSQGLTLQRAVVDLNQSFAPGQVYVALSRCTSMEGLVLRSRLGISNVIVDPRVIEFSRSENEEDELEAILKESMRVATAVRLCKIFSFADIISYTEQQLPDLQKRRTGPREQNLALTGNILKALQQAQAHAESFQKQLHQLVKTTTGYEQINERKKAGVTYFLLQVIDPATKLVDDHFVLLEEYPKVAKQTKAFTGLKEHLKLKARELNDVLG